LVVSAPVFAGVRYVNAALTTGANDGSTWANAFQGQIAVQSALAVSQPGDQLWCAAGSYKPTLGTTTTISFVLSDGVELYGGFVGSETQLEQRNPAANPTILTGLLGTTNSLHVIESTNVGANTMLDGFTVRDGRASTFSLPGGAGGGILCSYGAGPTVRNCTFTANYAAWQGGAVFADGSALTLENCRFVSNTGDASQGWGGAVALGGGSQATILDCTFESNSAANGGALQLIDSGETTVVQCIFHDNSAFSSIQSGGGAILVQYGNLVMRQCIVVDNHATAGSVGGIASLALLNLCNNIIYFNNGPGGAQGLLNNVQSANLCTWCCVQGITSGVGNTGADPLFVNHAGGDFHLQPTSPCADAGINTLVPAGTTTDLDGNPRFADDPLVADSGGGGFPVVDFGAYEVPNNLYDAFCAGDGSLPTACPCGNTGTSGRGCASSDFFSPGALLLASGASTPDSVTLAASDIYPSGTCVFLQGNQQSASGIVFGDGVRCVAGSLKRLFIKTASGGAASAPVAGDPTISARSAALGDAIQAGTQRFYQVYYRDSDLNFCPAPQGNTWNVSSGVIVNW